MFALTSILYIFLLIVGCVGSIVYHPIIGLIGYISAYNISPQSQWWGEVLAQMGIRSIMLLAIATAVGSVIHRSKLNFNKLFKNQEFLLIIFLGIILFSIPLGLGFSPAGSNAIKMVKVTIVILLASHIITDIKRYEILIWTLILAGLYLGYQINIAPDWMFRDGRFNAGLGGSDFSEGNFLGAHFALLLPFIGIYFFKGNWKIKIVCIGAGILILNSIVICRSRGVFLSILFGFLAAIIFSVPGKRHLIIIWGTIGILGTLALVDPGFWNRMDTINIQTDQMDSSSQGRIYAWNAALSMVTDHPLGIGEGNFQKYVGQYNPEIPGKDTHNTYLRCLAELGIQGFMILSLLIINAFRVLNKINKRARELSDGADLIWHVYGLRISLVVFLVCGMTMTHTYIEELYWLLVFPVFLERSLENKVAENEKP